MKAVLWDFNAGVGKVLFISNMWRAQPSNKTNGNGKQMVNFELGRDLAVREFYINIKAYMKSPDDH